MRSHEGAAGEHARGRATVVARFREQLEACWRQLYPFSLMPFGRIPEIGGMPFVISLQVSRGRCCAETFASGVAETTLAAADNVGAVLA